MKYKTLFRLALKLIGVMTALQGVYALGYTVHSICATRIYAPTANWSIVSDGLAFVGCLLWMLLGAYLFFRGEWIVNLAIPSNHPYCPECAYDLTGAPVERCPECGTAFRWEDVKPKIEDRSPKIET